MSGDPDIGRHDHLPCQPWESCPDCAGSRVAAWAVESVALRVGVLLADTVALATGMPVALMEIDDSMRAEARTILAAVREEAKKQ